jgi:hypothetical protein
MIMLDAHSFFTDVPRTVVLGKYTSGPFPFGLCATGRTCGPGGRRLLAEPPLRARTTPPHCYRPPAAVPSSPPSEQEPELERAAQAPGQRAVTAVGPKRPSVAFGVLGSHLDVCPLKVRI